MCHWPARVEEGAKTEGFGADQRRGRADADRLIEVEAVHDVFGVAGDAVPIEPRGIKFHSLPAGFEVEREIRIPRSFGFLDQRAERFLGRAEKRLEENKACIQGNVLIEGQEQLRRIVAHQLALGRSSPEGRVAQKKLEGLREDRQLDRTDPAQEAGDRAARYAFDRVLTRNQLGHQEAAGGSQHLGG